MGSRRRRKKKSLAPLILMSVAILMVCGLLVWMIAGKEDNKNSKKEEAGQETEENLASPVISITTGNGLDSSDGANSVDGNANGGDFAGEAFGDGTLGDGENGASDGDLAGGNGDSAGENAGGDSADDGWDAGGKTPAKYENGQQISFNPSWEYGGFSKINSGSAVFYAATTNRKGIVVGVNAGHGTQGGQNVKTYCHPDMTPKVTGGTTAAGSVEAVAVSGGMSFNDGTPEAKVNLKLAGMIRDQLLAKGYDVLMIRDGDDVQLDNVARTVMCNNIADCHIAIHFDGDGLGSDKGCFYISVPDALKSMSPVDRTWQMSEELGTQIVTALGNHGLKLYKGGKMAIDLTQTSYSTVPSVDVEYGNQSSDISDSHLAELAAGTADGVDAYFLVAN